MFLDPKFKNLPHMPQFNAIVVKLDHDLHDTTN